MGYSLSWLAVKGKTRDAVLGALELRATGGRQDRPESPLAGAILPGGWYLVVAGRTGHRLIREGVMAQLSADSEAVTLDVEEHVMVSEASGWKSGRKMWTVLHDAQRNTEHLKTEGQLPSVFLAIREKLVSKQQEAGLDADVDYIFDCPVELAKALTGYRHDEVNTEFGEKPFEALESKARNPRSWIQRLFGR